MSKNTNQNPETPEQAQEPDALAEGGRKALEAEREARKRAEREAREARERAARLERDALRRKVAEDKGVPEAAVEFLTGDTEQELAEAADHLLAAFKPADADLRRTPREHLRPGAVPSSEPSDFGDLADRVRSRL